MKRDSRPKNYGSYADFEREELQPMNGQGFSVADLEAEAIYKGCEEQVEEGPDELFFD